MLHVEGDSEQRMYRSIIHSILSEREVPGGLYTCSKSLLCINVGLGSMLFAMLIEKFGMTTTASVSAVSPKLALRRSSTRT